LKRLAFVGAAVFWSLLPEIVAQGCMRDIHRLVALVDSRDSPAEIRKVRPDSHTRILADRQGGVHSGSCNSRLNIGLSRQKNYASG
jgi:hypothetical protein